MISRSDVEHVAALARLGLTDEEIDRLVPQLSRILEAVGIRAVKLPPRSPNLNANLERGHRSVKEECLSKLILFGANVSAGC